MRRSVHRNKLILKLVETQLTVLKHSQLNYSVFEQKCELTVISCCYNVVGFLFFCLWFFNNLSALIFNSNT